MNLRIGLSKKPKLMFIMGSNFGKAGDGYIRLNLAIPRKQLEQALNQIKDAYGKIKK